ncbi:hypothetical protein R3P38DRAFT_1627636 [Favolaschia claudopus]|uniref:Uncharacterized protein n=1 Tax=Favolaschia claudopus TaxID=2862362 RepID=A0AAW0AH12_9AGAR
MAILAPPDWQYSPRDPAMDKGPSQSSSSSSTNPNQQRPSHQQQQPHNHPQQQYPFQVQQQQQGNWTPSLAAQPFYPAAYYQQNGPQTPPQQYGPPPNPYFDPANAQLAQWAYQQMMFNAQQHAQQHPHVPQHDFFAPPGMHGQFNPFPSGTPPPRPADAPQPPFGSGPPPPAGAGGYHPYRRPSRQQSTHSEPSVPQSSSQQDWARGPQPPYSRPDASGSSSSVNSQGRTRTNSNNSQSRGSNHSSPASSTKGSSPQPGPQSTGQGTGRGSSSPGPPPPRIPHHRAGSSSSNHSTHSAASSASSPGASSSASSSAAKLARPSPLSQGAVTASTLPPTRSPLSSSSSLNPSTRAERRISRDDSSLALSSLSLLATRAEATSSHGASKEDGAAFKPVKGSGLKGRLRRALSFNASLALKEEVGGADDMEGEGGEDEDEDERYHHGGEGSDSDESIKASVVNPKSSSSSSGGTSKTPALIASATRRPGALPASSLSPAPGTLPSGSSAAQLGTQIPLPPPKKKSRAASLFNSRMNMSTDNISLSSTVSSASVMIRKLGSMGRLARRNSLAGITGLFKKKDGKSGDGEDEESGEAEQEGSGSGKKKKKGKERDKDKDKDKEKDKKSKRNGKGEASEASVSHATAELEAGDWSVPGGAGDATTVGLSPAAKLARQHTLKSNAEAAAKAKEAAARAAAAASNANANTPNPNGNGVGVNGGGVPTWERNTATRSPAKQRGGGVKVAEDGTRVLVEDSSESEDDYSHSQQQQQQQALSQQQMQQQWDDEDDEEWGLLGGEEDDTIRIGVEPGQGQDEYLEEGQGEEEEYEGGEHEPWATDIRRSVERARVPARGILKNAGTYDQASYLPDAGGVPSALRARSNSYNAAPGQSELGPLARIPSPDPDHIDGLHRHGSHSSAHGGDAKRSSVPSLPPLGFELGVSGGSIFDSPQVTPTAATYAAAGQAAPAAPTAAAPGHSPLFNHPNSSAPALTMFGAAPSGPLQSPVPRSATAPAKKHLAFASNLSVYDTFSASMYDRRSEPATWSRLTPALAQRIKEELNSYKMEEMEVHAASRIHTQFFV